MRHPLENNPLFQEMNKPDWADIVLALSKLGFFILCAIALIKYIL